MGRYHQWLWTECNLPADFREATIRDFDRSKPGNKRAAEAAIQFLTGELPTQWLAFQGGYGCGKTHLAAAIVRGFVLQGVHARYVCSVAMLEFLKEQIGKGQFQESYDSLKRLTVLAIDDFGMEYSTDWARETMEELIDYRYREGIPTVITTNLQVEQIKPRILSRLKDQRMCTLVLNDAPDFREGQPVTARKPSASAQKGYYWQS